MVLITSPRGLIMHSKLRAGTGLCLFLAAIVAHAAAFKTEALKLGDVNADLRVLQGTPLDVVSQQKITYAVTGNAAYDEFFKKAAVAYAGFAVGNRMSEEAVASLKQLAASLADSKDGKDPRSLTLDEVRAILKEKKGKRGLEPKDIEHLGKVSQSLAVAGMSLTGSVEATAALLPQMQPLVANAGKVFTLWDFPNVAKEIVATTKRLTSIKDEAQALAKNVSIMKALVMELTAAN